MSGPEGGTARPTASVDHELCVGVAQCVRLAPQAFVLDDEELSNFSPTGDYTLDQLEQAVQFCPMAAITIEAAED